MGFIIKKTNIRRGSGSPSVLYLLSLPSFVLFDDQTSHTYRVAVAHPRSSSCSLDGKLAHLTFSAFHLTSRSATTHSLDHSLVDDAHTPDQHAPLLRSPSPTAYYSLPSIIVLSSPSIRHFPLPPNRNPQHPTQCVSSVQEQKSIVCQIGMSHLFFILCPG